jgi:hypothetical protein
MPGEYGLKAPDDDDGPVTILLADITTMETDAIVNAANEGLLPGGGVCGAIHTKAGPRLAAACQPLAPCPTGEARITPGFDLKAPFVIHTVGPIWQGGSKGEAELLASCYRNSITWPVKTTSAQSPFRQSRREFTVTPCGKLQRSPYQRFVKGLAKHRKCHKFTFVVSHGLRLTASMMPMPDT